MFMCERKIFLKDTDVTGVIYFGALLQYALEAFEVFLHEKDFKLADMFSKGHLFPVVHAEADYKAPLRVGDGITIKLFLSHLGQKSFTLETEVYKMPLGVLAGKTKIVHAFLLQGAEASSSIPKEFSEFLTKNLSKS